MRRIILALLLGFSLNNQAQDIIVKNDGESLKAYNLEISGQSVFYTLTEAQDDTLHKLSKSDILIIKKADGTKIQFEGDMPSKPAETASVQYGNPNLPNVDIANYKGFLLDKGNAVFVVSGPTSYEQAGANRLRELLSKDDYWQLAANEEQAHFIIKYYVIIKGQDHLEFYYLDRRNRLSPKEMRDFYISTFGNGHTAITTSENDDDNIVAAGKLFDRIKRLQEKLDKVNNYKKGWYKLFYQE